MEQIKNIKDYIKPSSLTWWAGLGLLALGVMALQGVVFPGQGAVMAVVEILAGGTDPAFLIASGLAFIGIRAKLGRAGGSV